MNQIRLTMRFMKSRKMLTYEEGTLVSFDTSCSGSFKPKKDRSQQKIFD